MPPMFRLLPLFFAPFFSPADGGAAGGGVDADADGDDQHDESKDRDDQDDDKLGDAGKKALDAERDLRKKAEKDARDLKKRLDTLEAEKKKRDEDKATENGEFEKLANDRAAEIEDLKQQIKDRDAKDTKAAIAKKHGIPDELIAMLQGETEDDIEASAKTVAKHLKVRDTTDIDAGEKSQTKSKDKTPDKKAFADPARWGLRPN